MEFPGQAGADTDDAGDATRSDGAADLRGTPASPGSYTGPVRVVRSEADFGTVLPGEVLVCPSASPAWTFLFALVGAVVADGGGPLAHAAIVAREHGLPAVLGTGDATRRLTDGQLVTVDGTAGTVTPI
jgi:pyruvate,water dikinase